MKSIPYSSKWGWPVWMEISILLSKFHQAKSNETYLIWYVIPSRHYSDQHMVQSRNSIHHCVWRYQLWGFDTLGKFDWGVRYVIIFLYVQFWIRLGTVSYRGKKVRTVDSPAVRSVNKSRGTRNSVQNEPKYAICVLVTTRLYYKAPGIILCALIYQIRHNDNSLDDVNVKLQFTARCQHWARPVPWWQPMKIP